jgi:hypothetical protein
MAALRKPAILMLATLLATPAAAQMRPSSPDDIAAGVSDCWAAVGPETVSLDLLRQRGWEAGSIESAKGPVETPLKFYGKSGSNVVMMLQADDDSPTCSIMSRVAKVADIDRAAQAAQRSLSTVDPQLKATRSDNALVFLSLPKIGMIQASGTKDAPGVRVIVSYQKPEKK